MVSCTTLFPNRNISEIPEDAKTITTDIANFYKAFELAIQDSDNSESIFEEHYFKQGSKGLKDFYKTKIRSKEKFANFVIKHRDFYRSIKDNISNISDLENQILVNFREFKRWYPEAVFPDIYFLVGRFSSNGTISKNGLLIGTEILGRTADTDTKNWNKNILRISMERKHIPVTVAHELVHFNQDNMKEDNTLLGRSLREGSAEFIAEIISGYTDGEYSGFKGIEKEIWKDFKKEMNEDIWSSWHQKSEKRPRNAGYWAGYMICKAYHKQVGDTKKAIHDILHIKNYRDFYNKSGVESYINSNSTY